MKFIVTYRGADGAVCEERIEAASRAECFTKCRARGILPTVISEDKGGKGRSAGGKSRTGTTPSAKRRSIVYVALFVLVALATGIWWWMGTRSKVTITTADPPKRKSGLPKQVTPAKAPLPTMEPVANQMTNVTPKTQAKLSEMTREERIAMLEKKILENPPNMSVRSNRVFSTGLEQSLAAIFSTPLGAPPPLISPRLSPVTLVHLQRILDAPNEVFDTDDEKTVQAKIACAAAKKAMKEYIDGGGDPEKFLEHYHSVLKQANEEWKEAQFKLIETMKTDPGLAPTLEAEINEHFSAKGMRPVKMPPGLKERYGIK